MTLGKADKRLGTSHHAYEELKEPHPHRPLKRAWQKLTTTAKSEEPQDTDSPQHTRTPPNSMASMEALPPITDFAHIEYCQFLPVTEPVRLPDSHADISPQSTLCRSIIYTDLWTTRTIAHKASVERARSPSPCDPPANPDRELWPKLPIQATATLLPPRERLDSAVPRGSSMHYLGSSAAGTACDEQAGSTSDSLEVVESSLEEVACEVRIRKPVPTEVRRTSSVMSDDTVYYDALEEPVR